MRQDSGGKHFKKINTQSYAGQKVKKKVVDMMAPKL